MTEDLQQKYKELEAKYKELSYDNMRLRECKIAGSFTVEEAANFVKQRDEMYVRLIEEMARRLYAESIVAKHAPDDTWDTVSEEIKHEYRVGAMQVQRGRE